MPAAWRGASARYAPRSSGPASPTGARGGAGPTAMEERRIRGRRVDDFPPRRTRWDLSRVADGQVYLLRKGRDFEIEAESLAIAAPRWARLHGYRLTTRSEFDERQQSRPKVGPYVQIETKGARRRRPAAR
jgi:hypothetical protein